MKQRSARRLDAYSQAWTAAQAMTSIAPTARAAVAPSGMIRIRGGSYEFFE